MNLLALDLGTSTGWALRASDGNTVSGTESFKPGRFEGGGMRYLRFKRWLTEIKATAEPLGAIYFEEVRRHIGVDAAHAYGGFLGTIKKHATGKGNASKDEMVAAMRALGHQPGDDDEADALALLTLAVSLAETVSAINHANTCLRGLCVAATHTSTHEGARESSLSTIGNP